MSSRGKKKTTQKLNTISRKEGRYIDNLQQNRFVIGKSKDLQWWIFYDADMAGCGHYRSIFPSQAISLFQNHPKYKVHVMNANRVIRDPNFYKYTNLVQIQRWDQPHHIDAMNYLMQMKIHNPNLKIVYDIDDDIPNMPDYNYFKAHGYLNHFKIMEQIMSHSDLLIVSCPKLKKVYSYLNKNIEVITNYLPKWIWGEAQWINTKDFVEKSGVMNILWAGSATHFSEENSGDLEFFTKLIKKTINKYNWIFLGAIPPGLSGNNVFSIPWKTMLELPLTYKSIHADVAIASLQNNEFNKSKSWIKALEYIAAGFPGIYSDIEPYKRCSTRFNSQTELEQLLETCYNSVDHRKKIWEMDYQEFRTDLWIEDNIYKRINVYCK